MELYDKKHSPDKYKMSPSHKHEHHSYEDMNRAELLKQLTALDFLALDLHLYLDTHPCDKKALATYNCIIIQSEVLRESYQSQYGPLYSFRSPSPSQWQWINNPWPWNSEFNFELAGEEK